MTVETQTNKVVRAGNGVATSFSFSPIVIFEADDLLVVKTSATGVETALARGTGSSNYSVSVSAYPGTGSITYPASGTTYLATGETLTIKRLLTLEQTTDYENQGGYFADIVETSLDRLTMIDLQQQDDIDRAIKLPVSEVGGDYDMTLPAETDRASKFLAFDADGNIMAAAGTSANLGPVSSFVNTLLDDANAAAFMTTLGMTATGQSIATAANAAAVRSTIGLGTVATANTGTSAGNVPLAENVIGKQTIWVPAAAMVARTTNGAASGTAETSTNKVMLKTLDFDTTTQEFAQFTIHMPKGWNEGTVTFQPVWSHAATTTNFGVVWALEAVALSDDDGADAAFGTAQTSTDTGGTTNDIYIGPESAAITIGGSPAENDYVVFQIKRNVSDGSDTLAIDARLHGIKLFYTTNTGVDS